MFSRGRHSAPMTRKSSSLLRPDMTIFLKTGSTTTYSTFDKIEGTLSIRAWEPIPFEHISIQFRGTTNTLVQSKDPTATHKITQANHVFLKLEEPIAPQHYPSPKILQADQTYEFDFEFYIPEKLHPLACTHRVANKSVKEAHLQLPPTLRGDGTYFTAHPRTYDVMTPSMISTSYEIMVRLWDEEGSVASMSRTVRVIPRPAMQTPLPTEANSGYRLRDERLIRKGPFKKKSGIVWMETGILGPLPYTDLVPRYRQGRVAKSAITIHFDPVDCGSTPPRLGVLKSRLLVTSYYGSKCRQHIPTMQSTPSTPGQEIYSAKVNFPPIHCDEVGWYRVPHAHTPSDSLETDHEAKRHDSFTSAISFGSRRSSVGRKLCSFEMRLDVPIVLPRGTVLVPTFHSCLVSRTYTLQLHFEIEGGEDVDLEVPVVITAA